MFEDMDNWEFTNKVIKAKTNGSSESLNTFLDTYQKKLRQMPTRSASVSSATSSAEKSVKENRVPTSDSS